MDPRGSATRAQVATILQRFAPMVKNQDVDDDQEQLQKSADKYLSDKQYEKAADCYRQMLEKKYLGDKEFGDALYIIAIHAKQDGQMDLCTALVQEGADRGSAEATNELGGRYYGNKDYEKAFFYYKQAADLGSAAAMYNTALCYENGLGTEKNLATAFQWYQKSAEAGDYWGMYATGAWYATGTGTAFNKEQAIFWLEKYIETGDTEWMEYAPSILEYVKAQ